MTNAVTTVNDKASTSASAPTGAAIGSRDTSTATNIMSYLVLMVGLLTVAVCAYMMVVSYSPIPYWDGWIQFQYPAAGGNPFSPGWLWAQYDEHRMPIPKLFLAADLHWLHGTQVLLLSSIFAVQLLHLSVLAWAMRTLGHWCDALWRTGVGFAAFCLFCLSQWENLTWGMQVCFVLPGLFASISFASLLFYWLRGDRKQWRYILVSIAAALGATWSYANGNLLWPLLLLAALLLRLPLGAVSSYALAGTASTTLFAINYRPAAYIIDPARTPLNTLKYFATYFGSSWLSGGEHTHAAEIIGMIGFGSALFFLCRLRRYIESRRVLEIQLLLMVAFSLGSGLVTAFGRSGFGPRQAFSSRYQTVALLFWCSIALLVLGAVARAAPEHSASLPLTQTLLLLVMLGAATYAGGPMIGARARGFKLNAAAMSLASGVTDTEQLKWAFWRPSRLIAMRSYLRQQHLSVFHQTISQLIDRPLQPTFTLATPEQCSGTVESTSELASAGAVLPSLRLTGWAWDNVRREPAMGVIVATNGTITGLGAVGDWRPMHKASISWMAPNYLGYTAYIRQIGGPVQVYALLRRSLPTACAIVNR